MEEGQRIMIHKSYNTKYSANLFSQKVPELTPQLKYIGTKTKMKETKKITSGNYYCRSVTNLKK